MTFKEIQKRHRQDIAIKCTLYLVSTALFFVVVGCAYQLGHLKKDPASQGPVAVAQPVKAVPPTVKEEPVLQRSPADVGLAEQAQIKVELQRLQEENSKLRAALIELQQKVAASPSKKKEKTAANRKPSKVQKVASAKNKKKQPKIIQVSFDEGDKEPAKN